MIRWATRPQGPQSANSTESESSDRDEQPRRCCASKRALYVCRLKPVPCDGCVGNDALRLAVGRGSSAKLRHLRVDTCFRFLGQLPISIHRGGYNRKRGQHHDSHSDKSPRRMANSLGAPEEVCSCSCATSQLLSKLACV